jgi:hypothetical protein
MAEDVNLNGCKGETDSEEVLVLKIDLIGLFRFDS